MNKVTKLLEILSENPQLEIVSYGLAPRSDGFCYEYDDSYYGECSPRTLEIFEELLGEIESSNKLTKLLKNEIF